MGETSGGFTGVLRGGSLVSDRGGSVEIDNNIGDNLAESQGAVCVASG